MKRYVVRLTDDFLVEMSEIDLWLASRTSREFAANYIADAIDYAHTLEFSPLRGGVRRMDRQGLRIITFRGAIQIAYEVEGDEVVVARAFYRGRDVDQLLADYPSRSSE